MENCLFERVVPEKHAQEVAKGLEMYSSVFITAPMPRCGITFLSDIVRSCPDFQTPALLWEDFTLEHAHLLKEYAIKTSKRWEHEIKDIEDYQELLLLYLGKGIRSFLREHISDSKRLLCKTPAVYNIHLFSKLFPEARLLIVVRDGRDAVESAVRTWPHRILAHERSARRWARGVRLILDFTQTAGRASQEKSWRLVRYEDLVQRPEAVLGELSSFLGIGATAFDVTQVKRLPLRGSSEHRGARAAVHWDPVEKPKDFQPIGKWKSWSLWRKTIFKIIAGRELVQLGYANDHYW